MPAPKKRHSRLISYGYLLINTIVWGAALVVVKPAFEATTPFRFLWYRYIVAVVASLPILMYYLPRIKKISQTISTIVWLELIGTTLSLSLLYFGLAKTSAIEASLLVTTAPLFTTAFAVWLLKEHEERHELIGLTIAFLGTALLTALPLITGHTTLGNISLAGNLLIIAQNITTSVYFVLAKQKYNRLPKLFVTTISFYVGLATFGLLSVWEAGGPHTLWSAVSYDLSFPSVWVASVYMAIFGSIIGLTAYIKGQDGIEASEASLFTYLQPLVYIPMGIVFLGESVLSLQGLALGVILLGVLISEKRFTRHK